MTLQERFQQAILDMETLKEAALEAGLGEPSGASEDHNRWQIKTLNGFVGNVLMFDHDYWCSDDDNNYISVGASIFSRDENLHASTTFGGERFPWGQVPKAKFVEHFKKAARWIEEHLDHEYIEQLRGNDRRAKRWAEEINKRGK